MTNQGRQYPDGPIEAPPGWPRPARPAPPFTWWQRNWRSAMNWAVAIPCAGFIGPFLHPELAPAPWRWMTGLGLLGCVLTWIFEPKRQP